MLGKTQSVLICKQHAHRFSNLYILLRINHHSCFLIELENMVQFSTENQFSLLKAIAKDDIVAQPTSGKLIK